MKIRNLLPNSLLFFGRPTRWAMIRCKQDAYHRRKHESRIRTSTALIPREINMRELKHNSKHFS